MRKLSFLTLMVVSFLFVPLAFAQTNTDQADTDADQEAGDIEEVVVTGSQIKGAAISDALSVSVIDAQTIDVIGIQSGDELLDSMPEQGQNFFNDAENISGGVNSARGDIGAFNLRNIGTGNTLVLMNGRRVVNSAVSFLSTRPTRQSYRCSAFSGLKCFATAHRPFMVLMPWQVWSTR